MTFFAGFSAKSVKNHKNTLKKASSIWLLGKNNLDSLREHVGCFRYLHVPVK
jgi:hypothetical protein